MNQQTLLEDTLAELRSLSPSEARQDAVDLVQELIAEEQRYSPDQPRDPDGKFATGADHEEDATNDEAAAAAHDKEATKPSASQLHREAAKEAAKARREAAKSAREAARYKLAELKAATAIEKARLRVQFQEAKARAGMYRAVAKAFIAAVASLATVSLGGDVALTKKSRIK
jgi:hypothetical protein